MVEERHHCHWIDTQSDFNALPQRLAQADVLGMDTEFERRSTYYPRLALLQIGDREHIYLIDPLKIEDWSPLRTIFQNSSIKLLHSSGEDLELFRTVVGAMPEPLFDTQIAASFLGMGLSKGYANLLNELFGLELDKSETTSDWLQRPLTESQMAYAQEDVRWLPTIYDRFKPQLIELGRYDWCMQESALMIEKYSTEVPPSDVYLRLKNGWRFSDEALQRLQALSAWREETARSENKPRGWILKDTQLYRMAERNTQTLEAFRQLPEMHTSVVRKYGEAALHAISAAALQHRPIVPPVTQPVSGEQKVQLKQLQECVEKIAQALHIDPGVLAKKADLEQLIYAHEAGDLSPSPLFQGWRRQLVGEPLLQQLTQGNCSDDL